MAQAERIVEHVQGRETGKREAEVGEPERTKIKQGQAEEAVRIFADSFDALYGGFGAAPKFPTPHNLLFLLLYVYLEQKNKRGYGKSGDRRTEDGKASGAAMLQMVEKTLIQMRRGGLFDQIGGGFSRYSTDRQFLAPHFEKMLYDNALLILAYAAAYRMTKKKLYLQTAKETAEYVLREMRLPEGGFYSAQDADSEGVEGAYYTFTLTEVLEVLGKKRGKAFADAFDITKEGNFNGEQTGKIKKGQNIPNLLKKENFCFEGTEADGEREQDQEEKQALYEYRKKRMPLHLDDKVLFSWNSMMITALGFLFRVSGERRYLQAAQQAQAFLEKHLCQNMAVSQ